MPSVDKLSQTASKGIQITGWGKNFKPEEARWNHDIIHLLLLKFPKASPKSPAQHIIVKQRMEVSKTSNTGNQEDGVGVAENK